MNEAVYKLYCNTKNLIEEASEELEDETLNYIEDLKLSTVILEEKNPEYKERYDEEHGW